MQRTYLRPDAASRSSSSSGGAGGPASDASDGVDAKDCARARPRDATAPSGALLEMLSAARSSCDALFGRDDAASAAIRARARGRPQLDDNRREERAQPLVLVNGALRSPPKAPAACARRHVYALRSARALTPAVPPLPSVVRHQHAPLLGPLSTAPRRASAATPLAPFLCPALPA